MCKGYEDLGFARVDHARKERCGWPEVIYGAGKTAEQIAVIMQSLMEHHPENSILATRCDVEKYEYVKQHTNSSMTNQQKIEALYNWVLKNDMVYYRTYEHVSNSWVWYDGWVDDFAASQMDKWGGNCYRYAAFLGMLIREATGLQVKVYQGQTPAAAGGLTYHGWTSVNQNGTWYVYDVELHKHSGYSTYACYKVPASSSSIHLYGEGFNLY